MYVMSAICDISYPEAYGNASIRLTGGHVGLERPVARGAGIGGLVDLLRCRRLWK